MSLVLEPTLREMLEEYVLVTDAFAHWSKIKGPGSNEAVQYERLIQERSEEIRAFVQSEKRLHENPGS